MQPHIKKYIVLLFLLNAFNLSGMFIYSPKDSKKPPFKEQLKNYIKKHFTFGPRICLKLASITALFLFAKNLKLKNNFTLENAIKYLSAGSLYTLISSLNTSLNKRGLLLQEILPLSACTYLTKKFNRANPSPLFMYALIKGLLFIRYTNNIADNFLQKNTGISTKKYMAEMVLNELMRVLATVFLL